MDPTSDENDNVSKSQRKRDMLQLQALGERLTKLSTAQLKKLDLPDQLRDAVLAAQQITARGGHKRQLQYIGRIMRELDPQPIQQQLDDLLLQSASATRHFHQLEQWRERLLNDGDDAVTELVQLHPETDIQHLRQLIRTAQKEKLGNKSPRAARAIFQYLRELMESAS